MISQAIKIRDITKKELSSAVSKSSSFSQVLKEIGINHRSGNNLYVLKEKMKEFNLSVARFGPYETIYKNQDRLKEAVRKNISLSGVLKDLGLRAAGGNYESIKKWISKLDLDTSHFKGKSHGTSGAKIKKPLKEILVKNSYYQSSNLKKRLIQEGIFKNVCIKCSQTSKWNGELLVMHLDHINGVHSDNRLENLRILCPNCHSQTETYCRRN